MTYSTPTLSRWPFIFFLWLFTLSSLPSLAQAEQVLFVVGNTSLSAGDRAVSSYLQSQAHDVVAVDDQQSVSGDATGKDLVIISESVSSGRVGDKFNQVGVPVLVYESYLYDNLGLTGTASTEFGTLSGQRQIALTGSHPLTGDLSGVVSVSSSAGSLSWGKPGTQAVVAATLTGDNSRAAIFGYDSGATLANGQSAPARRVALYPGAGSLSSWTTDAQQLFNAAVQWALSESSGGPIDPVNRPPIVSAGSDADATVGQGLTLLGSVGDDGVSTPLTILWTEQAGVSFSDITDPKAVVTFAGTGTYQLELVASDSEFTVRDNITIRVTEPAEPPVGGQKRILFVVGSVSLSTGDRSILTQLQSGNMTVEVVDDQLSQTSDSTGKDLIIISESVSSGKVGNKFNRVAVPVLVYEAYLYDNMALTGTASSEFGTQKNQTQLVVTGSHALTGGLSGQVAVNANAGAISWGRPGSQAQVAATVSGDSNKAVIFGYEAGAQLANGTSAPARRVAFFPGSGISSSRTASARQLFDAAVQWSLAASTGGPIDPEPVNQPPVVSAGTDRQVTVGTALQLNGSVSDDGIAQPLTVQWSALAGATIVDRADLSTAVTFTTAGTYVLELVADDSEFTVRDTVEITVSAVDQPPAPQDNQALFVVGNTSLSANDRTILEQLQSHSLAVTVVSDQSSKSTDATGMDLIVISESVNSGKVGSKFTQAAVPILTYESYLYDDLGMTSAASGSYGTLAGQRQLAVQGSHSLTGGFSGQTTVSSSSGSMSWGVPGAQATIAATIAGDTSRAVIFGYESGDLLVNGQTAPARRVAFYPNKNSLSSRTAAGQQLFDAALLWATGESSEDPVDPGPSNKAPQVMAGADADAIVGVAMGLEAVVEDDGVATPLTVQWQNVEGATFADRADPTTTVTFSAAGTYQLELVVSDTEFTVSDSMTVSVVDPSPSNNPPVVEAGASGTVGAGVEYQLSGSVDDDGIAQPLSVQWTALAGATFADSTSPATTVTFSSAGDYELELVADDTEFSVSDTVVITVEAPTAVNLPPSANAGADVEIAIGQSVELNGSLSADSDGNIVSWEWRMSGGVLIGSGEAITWAPSAVGTTVVTLTVTDDRGDMASATVSVVVIARKPNVGGYDLVFNDEFNGSELDPGKWNTGLLWGPYLPINDEEQLYVDTLGLHDDFSHSPFVFTGDTLKITATATSDSLTPPVRPDEDSDEWAPYSEYRYNGPTADSPGYQASDVNYLSGIITSYDTFKMTHGYVEMRAKLPVGSGLWPAFWLLTTHYVGDVPEIDVMEFLGDDVSTVYHTYHYFDVKDNWRAVSTPSFQSKAEDWTADFHDFGMAWTPKAIVWYVDGKEVRRITNSDYLIPNQAMYLLANLAVGGSWPGAPGPDTLFPAEFEIDYIRAYKKKLDDPINLAQHQLVFSDEFEGPTLDASKWNTSFLWGPFLTINDEKQYYVDSLGADRNDAYSPFVFRNVDGKSVLSITADSAENSGATQPPDELPPLNDAIWTDFPRYQKGPYTAPPPYTSGIITSYDAFKFVNGYAEINARIPGGDGLWPAFWLLNAYYVGPQPEIDVMEILTEEPGTLYHTYHRRGAQGIMTQTQYITQSDNAEQGFADGFHRYGVQWQPGKLTWYLDGVPVHSYSGSDVGYQMMYVIANLAVGGSFNSAEVDPSIFPVQYDIDYIKVWQVKDTQ